MIEFRNVTKTYDTGTKAVKNANFLIRRTNNRKYNNKWKRYNIFKTK